MVILFFRLIERIHLAVDESGKNLGKGHGDLGLSQEQTCFDEAPLIMLIPLLVAAATVLVIGIYNQEVVNQIEQIINRFNFTSTEYYEKAPKLVIALVLDTREGYGKQVEGIQLNGDNKVSYVDDHDFSKQYLIIDGSKNILFLSNLLFFFKGLDIRKISFL